MSAVILDCSITRMVVPLCQKQAGRSAFVLLEDNRLALLSRLALADRAEHALDLQYYFIRGDLTGLLLVQRALAAADRGVKVRILVDDAHAAGQEPLIAALDRHANIDVRLFNPFRRHYFVVLSRLWQMLTRGRRLTRRMHNKAFIVDGAAAIVGGRNLGDEYFDAGEEFSFHDLDLVVFGPAVTDVGASFERFWRSEASHPVRRVAPEHGRASLPAVREQLTANLAKVRESEFATALRDADLLQQIFGDALQPFWGEAEVVSDDPDKVDPDLQQKLRKRRFARWRRRRPARTTPRIVAALSAARREITLLSPYFVPGKAGCAFLEGLRERGVRVRVLTNSLSATDVPAVHAGYERYRRRLLQAGIEIHEMRREWPRPRLPSIGSSAVSLHAKAFTVDNEVAFVGSMNLDPRSAFLNTELGIIVRSVPLAARIDRYFDVLAGATRSYRVTLETRAGMDRLRWDWTDTDGQARVSHGEPDASLWRRAVAQVFSWLPVESQL